MYTLLLTSRYLFRKMTPLVGMLATLLCVGLIIVVSSIMGGFMDMVLQSGKTVIGDVLLSANGGIPQYEKLQERIEALPEAQATSPTVRTYGLVRMNLRSGAEVAYVEVLGIKGESYAQVTGFGETLYWTPERIEEAKLKYQEAVDEYDRLKDERLALFTELNDLHDVSLSLQKEEREKQIKAVREKLLKLNRPYNKAYYRQRSFAQILSVYGHFSEFLAATQPGMPDEGIDPKVKSLAMENFLNDEEESDIDVAAMIMGMEINPRSRREADGDYTFTEPLIGRKVALTVVPVSGNTGGSIRGETASFRVINDFMTGFFTLDSRRVYVPFDVAQRMAKMDEEEIVDASGDEIVVLGVVPARATEILVKAAPGYTADQLKAAVEKELDAFREDMRAANQPNMAIIHVSTWEDMQRDYLAPIKKEKGLLTFLFGIISCVVVGMTIVIFYMIVLQKTRDIGILRSLGASQTGVAGIFLIYAFVVSVIGALLGTGVGALIVTYINPIHEWMGTRFGQDLFAPVLGLGVAALVFVGILGYVLGQGLREKFYRGTPTLIFTMASMVSSLIAGLLIWQLYGIQQDTESMTPAWLQGELPWMLVGLIGIIAGALLIMMPGFIVGQAMKYKKISAWWMVVPTGVAFLAALVVGVVLVYGLEIPELKEQLGMINLVLWDKQVYYFTEIPHEVNWSEVAMYNIIAVIASVAGAFIPAMMAARVDPVSTLRYE